MKWIMFYMNPSGERFRYTTNILHPEKSSMAFKKFMDFIFTEFPIWHRAKFIKELESFQTILLHQSGEWEVIKSDIDPSKYTFDDMAKYQDKKERMKDRSHNVFERNAKENMNLDSQEKIIKGLFDKIKDYYV